MVSIDLWERYGAQIILKCLNSLGVTTFLPPSGEAHADTKIQPYTLMKNNFFRS